MQTGMDRSAWWIEGTLRRGVRRKRQMFSKSQVRDPLRYPLDLLPYRFPFKRISTMAFVAPFHRCPGNLQVLAAVLGLGIRT